MYSSSTPESGIDRTRDSARRTLKEARDAINETKNDANAAAHDLGKRTREFVNTAGEEISHTTNALVSQIRGNPMRSSAIALGVGVFLGALLRRR